MSLYRLIQFYCVYDLQKVVQTLHVHVSFSEDSAEGSINTHTVESVQDLVKMLSDIGNWEALCTNLGVRQAVMSELIHSPLEPSIKKKRCLESYFDSGHAHWEEVIAAVVGPGIFNERVAKKIADKYVLDYKAILDQQEWLL